MDIILIDGYIFLDRVSKNKKNTRLEIYNCRLLAIIMKFVIYTFD